MTYFEYRMSARKNSITSFCAAAILLPCGLFAYSGYQAWRSAFETVGIFAWFMPTEFVLVLLFLGLLSLGGLLILYSAIKNLLLGGEWYVKLTDHELIWLEPPGEFESFQKPISEISTITIKKKVKLAGDKQGDTEEDIDLGYKITFVDGKSIKLTTNSGINMQEFTAAAEKASIAVNIETTTIDKRKNGK